MFTQLASAMLINQPNPSIIKTPHFLKTHIGSITLKNRSEYDALLCELCRQANGVAVLQTHNSSTYDWDGYTYTLHYDAGERDVTKFVSIAHDDGTWQKAAAILMV